MHIALGIDGDVARQSYSALNISGFEVVGSLYHRVPNIDHQQYVGPAISTRRRKLLRRYLRAKQQKSDTSKAKISFHWCAM